MTGNQAAIKEAAKRAAGVSLDAVRRSRDETAMRGGPEAVAKAACPNGTDKDRAAIAAEYVKLQQQAAGVPAA